MGRPRRYTRRPGIVVARAATPPPRPVRPARPGDLLRQMIAFRMREHEDEDDSVLSM